MRLVTVIFLALLPVLGGCKLIPPGNGFSDQTMPQTIESEGGIEATSLDGGAKTTGDGPSIRPKPRPGKVADQTAISDVEPPAADEPTTPETQKTKEQITCEKQGGLWQSLGESIAKACIKRTRDGGKQCRKESDCDGVCLARSRTCAPVKPLFGCNEILQNDGRRVTLCID